MKDNQPLASSLAEEFRAELGVDSRFALIEGETISGPTGERLRFRVSSDYLKSAVAELAAKRLRDAPVEILLLPAGVLPNEKWAICIASVAPVVRNATHRSEQVTQFLIGESADVLELTPAGWVRVRLHLDGYLGWVNRNQVVLLSEKTATKRQKGTAVTTREKVVEVHSAPSRKSEPVTELLAGTTLPYAGRRGGWIGLRLPQGGTGWIESSKAVEKPAIPQKSSSPDIIRTARNFLGVPYFWGGRSVKAFDCSGFTQTVFRLHGIELPRDAALQWQCGMDVGNRLEDLAEGDLVFFGPEPAKVTHVGIATGERGEFIHSSGLVMVSSLDPGHPEYAEDRARTFLGARRLGTID